MVPFNQLKDIKRVVTYFADVTLVFEEGQNTKAYHCPPVTTVIKNKKQSSLDSTIFYFFLTEVKKIFKLFITIQIEHITLSMPSNDANS